MAAMVAVIAAIIAYAAAMAKVRLDRELVDREIARKKLSLYLRLEIVLQELGNQTRIIAARTPVELYKKKILVGDMQVSEPQEIEEAWDKLEVLPMATIKEMRTIRSLLRTCARRFEGRSPQEEIEFSIISDPKDVIRNTNKATTQICTACESAVDQLGTAIRDIMAAHPSL